MNLLQNFKDYLLGLPKKPSKVTLKNYLSDIRKFIVWYESSLQDEFSPTNVTQATIARFREELSGKSSASSIDRYISSLRKFYHYLSEARLIYESPFSVIEEKKKEIDTWDIRGFKDYLYTQKVSAVTTKNYLSDIHHFKNWCEQTLSVSDNYQISKQNVLANISPRVLEDYKSRMLEIMRFSPKSINRKLSSIRKYLSYAQSQGLIGSFVSTSNVVPLSLSLKQLMTTTQDTTDQEEAIKNPIAKLLSPYSILEEKAASHFAEKINESKIHQAVMPTQSGQPDPLKIKNIPKDFYAPHEVATEHYSLWKKLGHHIKYSRPDWYKKYHSIPAVHYVHFATLIILASGVGYVLFHDFFEKSTSALGYSQAEATRVMSFQGKLTDSAGNPITTTQNLRFALYNDPESSGSALLWQEVQTNVKPDKNGVFSVTLGRYNPITETILKINNSPYIGITVGTEKELEPRQRISTISYAANAGKLSGMSAITDNPAATSNVILALDSSGKLTIGGTANPVFQAIGGEFKLTGNNLVLATNADSNTNVVLSPDGFGQIDLQKALINSTDTGSINPGAVEVHDKLAVVATDSASAAFIVDNNAYGGDIFAASRSGITKFVINTDGFVGIGTSTPAHALDVQGDLALSGNLIVNGTRYILPEKDGVKNSYLMTDGAGTLSWTNNLGYITLNNGLLSFSDTNASVLIGGTSTDSAKFAFINSSTPQLKMSGDLVLSGNSGTVRKITTTNGNTLQVGDSNTGNVVLSQSGNVGIGTSNPNAKLEVDGTIRITHLAPANGTQTALCHSTNSLTDQDIVDCASNLTADYMEMYSVTPGVEEGDILGIGTEYVNTKDNDRMTSLTRATTQSQSQIIGIASNPLRAGDFNSIGYNIHGSDNPFPVALSGRVYVKVSRASATINPGDYITVSEEPGKGMKATQSSFVVGKALESWNSNDSKDKVLVFVERGWHQGIALSQTGTIEEDYTQQYTAESYNGQLPDPTLSYVVKDEFGQVSKAVGLFAKLFVGELEAGSIRTRSLAVEKSAKIGGTLTASLVSTQKTFTQELEVGSKNITIAGKSLDQYIAEAVNSQLSHSLSSGQAILNSQLASIGILKTGVISPLTDAEIAIRLNPSSIEITDQNNQPVATIDNKGNGTFNGNLSAGSISTTGDVYSEGNLIVRGASVAGTLTADHIAANTIDGLNEKVNTFANEYVSNRLEANQSNIADQLSTLNSQLSTSSISASIAMVSDDFISLGTSTLNELSVYGTAHIGQNFTLGENSLNVVGEDLNIQPLRQGGVNFLAGLVKIDIEGNLSVGGNAYFAKDVEVAGGLSANFLSPLSGNDFIIKLGQKARTQNLSLPEDLTKAPNFIIQNASGSAVVNFNQDGDVQASGSGTFAKLNLSLVSQALAVNDLEAVATGSAGIATLKANKPELTIQNKLVTKNSLIYITPTGNTEGAVLYLLRQVPGESFTVGTNQQNTTDLPFNWIIVN